MKRARLDQLAALATLRADRASSRLGRLQAAIDGLAAKAEALRAPMAEPPGSISEAVMRDRWDRWRSEQLRLANERILRLEAAAQPLRELRARDQARAEVLARLTRKAGR